MLARLLFNLRMHFNWLPKGHCNQAPLPYAKVQTIGLLIGDESRQLQDLMAQLKKDRKRLRSLRYYHSPRALEKLSAHERHMSFSNKDLHLTGLIQSTNTDRFLQEEYDLLINTSLLPIAELEHISIRCRAKLKIGLRNNKKHQDAKQSNYHWLIQGNSQKEALECAYSYLQAIK